MAKIKKLCKEELNRLGYTKQFFEDCLKQKMSSIEIGKKIGKNYWTVLKYMKIQEVKPLGASYFNKGINNPAKRKEVRKRISKTVKGLWNNGVYKDRINGMLYKQDWENPKYKPLIHYREYARFYYKKFRCYYCDCSENERKIDIHHLDENKDNFLLSNLLPVCNVCHQFFHFKRYKGPFVTIGKIFSFESCHHLMNYIGLCENNHGHSYELEVKIKGLVNRDTGMVIDYKNLSFIVKKYVVNVFDHKDLNEILDCNPTAENILFFIWDKLEKEGFIKGLNEILLKETKSSIAILTKKDMIEYYIRNKDLIIKKEKI